MAETYTVLARRYRSQNFSSLVGQEAIAQTLKNAITSHRVAHAFLFTGTRGVGKTSAARILAKALNCPNGKDGEPCNACETCAAIGRGEDMDVIEIDGASNNGVDQVRELRQNAGIRPARSEYKIYIIDEVHMLSIGAFNALLKTLEEPPSHVKFIFATTDVHKVPATIISRCQRFDFKNIATARIAGHLEEIIKAEGTEADKDALYRIARLGNGSMRDALSLLDRVMSLGEKRITEKLLEELLGKPAAAALAELVEALAAGDASAALTRADALVRDGMGVEQVLGDLVDFFRNIMMVSVCGKDTELLEVPGELRPLFVGLSQKYDGPTLVHLIALCEQVMRNLKGTTMARPLFDALIVRLAMAEQFSSIKEAMQGTGGSGGAVAEREKKNDVTGGGTADSGDSSAQDTGLSRRAGTQTRGTPEVAAEPVEEDDDDDLPAPGKVWKREERTAPQISVNPSLANRPGPAAAAEEEDGSIYKQLKRQLQNSPVALQSARPTAGRPAVLSLTGKSNVSAVSPETQQAMEAAVAQVLAVAPPDTLEEVWQRVRQIFVATKDVSTNSLLGTTAHLLACDWETGEAKLVVPPHLENFVKGRPSERVAEALGRIFKRPMKVVLTVSDAIMAAPQGTGEASRVMGGMQRVPPEVEQAVRASAVIKSLQEKLGGDVSAMELMDE